MAELPKICLNMIVKNESKIITRLLNSVSILIDYYVIVDTGSTDNTIEVITEFFKNKNIKGKILRKEFENFGTTRSYALDKCVSEPNSDFILLAVPTNFNDKANSGKNDFLLGQPVTCSLKLTVSSPPLAVLLSNVIL